MLQFPADRPQENISACFTMIDGQVVHGTPNVAVDPDGELFQPDALGADLR
jgi:hypothetical protein